MNLLISQCDAYDAEGSTLCCVQNEFVRMSRTHTFELFNNVSNDTCCLDKVILGKSQIYFVSQTSFSGMKCIQSSKKHLGAQI